MVNASYAVGSIILNDDVCFYVIIIQNMERSKETNLKNKYEGNF